MTRAVKYPPGTIECSDCGGFGCHTVGRRIDPSRVRSGERCYRSASPWANDPDNSTIDCETCQGAGFVDDPNAGEDDA